MPGHFSLIATSLNLPRGSAVALESDEHRYCSIFSRSARNYIVFRSCLASKQIILSLSRLCIVQSMILPLGSIFSLYASVYIAVGCPYFAISSFGQDFHTSTRHQHSDIGSPSAPRVRFGVYPTQRNTENR